MEKNSDLMLYELIQKKDKAALELLYDRYEKILFSFLYKMTEDRDVAEEALQEVFIKIWRGKGNYDESKGKFTSWLFTIARHTAIDLIRKRKKPSVPIDEVQEVADQETSVEELAEWQEKKDQLQYAMHQLSQEQQEMLQLFYFRGHTHETISALCSIPLGTVKSRIRLALKNLKKTLYQMQERGSL